MKNPIEHYTKKKEHEIPVDHGFLNRVEEKLFHESLHTSTHTKPWWKKILFPIVLIPSTSALFLILSFLYSSKTHNSPTAPENTVVLATVFEQLFREDAGNQLRRIEIRIIYPSRTGEKKTVHHVFWTYNESFRDDITTTHFLSHLSAPKEKKECHFSERKNKTFCYDESTVMLHEGIKKPTDTVTIQNVSRGSVATKDRYLIYIEWSTPYPVKMVTATHVGGTTNSNIIEIQNARWSHDFSSWQYLNKKENGIYHHRSSIEAGTLIERKQLRFQFQIEKKKKEQENSQILRYDFVDNTLQEIAYKDIRQYPLSIIYQSYFALPLYMVEHEDEFNRHATTTFEDRDGKRVTHVHFDVPKSKRTEVEDSINSWLIRNPASKARVASIDFWYLPHESRLLEYQVWNTKGQMMQQLIIDSDKVINDNPDDILSVRGWKEDVKKDHSVKE